MTPYDQTREYPRHEVKVRVVSQEAEPREFVTVNLSEGGMAVTCEKPPFVGEVLKLRIELGDAARAVELKAEVIWRKEGDGCGLRFFKPTAKQREALAAYLAPNAS